MTKSEIRKIAIERQRSRDPDWIVATSRVIQNRVLGLPEFRTAKVVCAYLAMRREVRTELIFEAAWISGKMTCIPAYKAGDDSYGLAELSAGTPLVPGHGRVREPADPHWVDADKVDLMLVPGLAFDAAGGRVGRGRGYYDRLLGSLAGGRALTVGLAFEFQVFENVPLEPHDMIVDKVITEKDTAAV